MNLDKPKLYTSLSPKLMHLYDLHNSIVVIIDVLRATSTIAAALYNGAKNIIPVDSVAECIRIGRQIDGVTAGERDGHIAEGLKHGNSPLEYPREFISKRTLVLTTTNGTKVLHMALDKGAKEIITGSFPNLSSVCEYLLSRNKSVVLGCAAWKDRLNLEDCLFAGAVIDRVKHHFEIDCDASQICESLFNEGKDDFYEFLKNKHASHFQRLYSFGLEKDIRYCLTEDVANVLCLYEDGKLVASNPVSNKQLKKEILS